MEKELVTVIITTYNRKDLLKRALESVINQTYKNLEIIIADNHSEDGTEDLCNEYLKKDSRIKYFKHDKNLGMTKNTNFAHRKSTGKYLHVLCDDDFLDLDFIEKCYEEFKKYPNYSFITPTVRVIDKDENVVSISPKVVLDSKNVIDRIKRYVIADKKAYLITNGLLKNHVTKDIIKEDGDALKNRFSEDWVYVIKYLIAGRCKVIDSTHYNKLNNGGTTALETMADVWNISKINLDNDNINFKIADTMIDSIKNDKFCKNKLSYIQRELISREILSIMSQKKAETSNINVKALSDNIKTLFLNIKKSMLFLRIFLH